MIDAYRKNGYQFASEGTTLLDGVTYRTLFFQTLFFQSDRIIVLVSDDNTMYQEYKATGNTGKIAKDF